jgi:hypothetical protein
MLSVRIFRQYSWIFVIIYEKPYIRYYPVRQHSSSPLPARSLIQGFSERHESRQSTEVATGDWIRLV